MILDGASFRYKLKIYNLDCFCLSHITLNAVSGIATALHWRDNVSQNLNLVENWVNTYDQNPNIKLKFGNHRKYESFSQLSEVINSYIAFIQANNGHLHAYAAQANDAKHRFENLYNDFNVYRFVEKWIKYS